MKRLAPFGAAAVLALAPAFAADVWQIDGAHSSAQFSVTHMMISTVRGEFGKISGTIGFDGSDPASIEVDATIDAASIDTHDAKRDGHLKSPDFFDVAKYPTITFKSRKVVAEGSGGFKLVGDLTMHGVRKEVTLDGMGPSKVIRGMGGESRVAASATTTINRQDWDIKWNHGLEGGGVVVSDKVVITIEIEAFKVAPAAPPKS